MFKVKYIERITNNVHYLEFESAEECRKWYVEKMQEKSCYVPSIQEIEYITFDRLKMLAQLERECLELGCQ